MRARVFKQQYNYYWRVFSSTFPSASKRLTCAISVVGTTVWLVVNQVQHKLCTTLNTCGLQRVSMKVMSNFIICSTSNNKNDTRTQNTRTLNICWLINNTISNTRRDRNWLLCCGPNIAWLLPDEWCSQRKSAMQIKNRNPMPLSTVITIIIINIGLRTHSHGYYNAKWYLGIAHSGEYFWCCRTCEHRLHSCAQSNINYHVPVEKNELASATNNSSSTIHLQSEHECIRICHFALSAPLMLQSAVHWPKRTAASDAIKRQFRVCGCICRLHSRRTKHNYDVRARYSSADCTYINVVVFICVAAADTRQSGTLQRRREQAW